MNKSIFLPILALIMGLFFSMSSFSAETSGDGGSSDGLGSYKLSVVDCGSGELITESKNIQTSGRICKNDLSLTMLYYLFGDLLNPEIRESTNDVDIRFLGILDISLPEDLSKSVKNAGIYQPINMIISSITTLMFILMSIVLFFFIIYNISTNSLNGEFLKTKEGKRANFYAYVKVVGALFMVAPIFHGMALVHKIIILISLFSISFANLVYSTFLAHGLIMSDLDNSLRYQEIPLNSDAPYIKNLSEGELCMQSSRDLILQKEILDYADIDQTYGVIGVLKNIWSAITGSDDYNRYKKLDVINNDLSCYSGRGSKTLGAEFIDGVGVNDAAITRSCVNSKKWINERARKVGTFSCYGVSFPSPIKTLNKESYEEKDGKNKEDILIENIKKTFKPEYFITIAKRFDEFEPKTLGVPDDSETPKSIESQFKELFNQNKIRNFILEGEGDEFKEAKDSVYIYQDATMRMLQGVEPSKKSQVAGKIMLEEMSQIMGSGIVFLDNDESLNKVTTGEGSLLTRYREYARQMANIVKEVTCLGALKETAKSVDENYFANQFATTAKFMLMFNDIDKNEALADKFEEFKSNNDASLLNFSCFNIPYSVQARGLSKDGTKRDIFNKSVNLEIENDQYMTDDSPILAFKIGSEDENYPLEVSSGGYLSIDKAKIKPVFALEFINDILSEDVTQKDIIDAVKENVKSGEENPIDKRIEKLNEKYRKLKGKVLEFLAMQKLAVFRSAYLVDKRIKEEMTAKDRDLMTLEMAQMRNMGWASFGSFLLKLGKYQEDSLSVISTLSGGDGYAKFQRGFEYNDIDTGGTSYVADKAKAIIEKKNNEKLTIRDGVLPKNINFIDNGAEINSYISIAKTAGAKVDSFYMSADDIQEKVDNNSGKESSIVAEAIEKTLNIIGFRPSAFITLEGGASYNEDEVKDQTFLKKLNACLGGEEELGACVVPSKSPVLKVVKQGQELFLKSLVSIVAISALESANDGLSQVKALSRSPIFVVVKGVVGVATIILGVIKTLILYPAVFIGLLLGYVLPLTPLLSFVMLFISWLILHLELFVVLPIWLMLFAITKKDGTSVGDIMLPYRSIGPLLLKPAFMVAGLIIGWYVANIAIYLLNISFAHYLIGQNYKDAATITKMISQIMGIFVYYFAIFVVISFSFKVFAEFSDKILRILGMQEQNDGGAADSLSYEKMVFLGSVGNSAARMADRAGKYNVNMKIPLPENVKIKSSK